MLHSVFYFRAKALIQYPVLQGVATAKGQSLNFKQLLKNSKKMQRLGFSCLSKELFSRTLVGHYNSMIVLTRFISKRAAGKIL